MELTATQRAEVVKLQGYFPYRIVYGAIKGDEFVANAVYSMRPVNKLAREGWTVFVARKS